MNDSKPKPCVLLVDDCPAALRALNHTLSPLYDVKVAKGGKAGLEIAKNHSIDLILLDLFMPDITGFEVIAHLKECDELKSIPVIFITGSNSSEDEAKALALGAIDYIRKPFAEIIVKLRVGIHLKMMEQLKIIEGFSRTDGLTGLNNRRCFDQTFKAEWSRAMREQEPLGMMMVDIDRFKAFNDRYGHMNGDMCLKVIAGVMEDTIMRGADTAFRWGGEEFAVILPNTPPDGVLNVAERLRQNIADTAIVCGNEIANVTVSIGVGNALPVGRNYPDIEAMDTFCAEIFKALYRAKAGGRDRVEAVVSGCGFN